MTIVVWRFVVDFICTHDLFAADDSIVNWMRMLKSKSLNCLFWKHQESVLFINSSRTVFESMSESIYAISHAMCVKEIAEECFGGGGDEWKLSANNNRSAQSHHKMNSLSNENAKASDMECVGQYLNLLCQFHWHNLLSIDDSETQTRANRKCVYFFPVEMVSLTTKKKEIKTNVRTTEKKKTQKSDSKC